MIERHPIVLENRHRTAAALRFFQDSGPNGIAHVVFLFHPVRLGRLAGQMRKVIDDLSVFRQNYTDIISRLSLRHIATGKRIDLADIELIQQ